MTIAVVNTEDIRWMKQRGNPFHGSFQVHRAGCKDIIRLHDHMIVEMDDGMSLAEIVYEMASHWMDEDRTPEETAAQWARDWRGEVKVHNCARGLVRNASKTAIAPAPTAIVEMIRDESCPDCGAKESWLVNSQPDSNGDFEIECNDCGWVGIDSEFQSRGDLLVEASKTANNIYSDITEYFGGDVMRRFISWLNQEYADHDYKVDFDYQGFVREVSQKVQESSSPEEAEIWLAAFGSLELYGQFDGGMFELYNMYSNSDNEDDIDELLPEANAIWDKYLKIGNEGVSKFGKRKTAMHNELDCPNCNNANTSPEPSRSLIQQWYMCYDCGYSWVETSGKKMAFDETIDQNPGEYDEEGDMVKSQLFTIQDAAGEMMLMLDDQANLPEWSQSQISVAEDNIGGIRDYMKSELALASKTAMPNDYPDDGGLGIYGDRWGMYTDIGALELKRLFELFVKTQADFGIPRNTALVNQFGEWVNTTQQSFVLAHPEFDDTVVQDNLAYQFYLKTVVRRASNHHEDVDDNELDFRPEEESAGAKAWELNQRMNEWDDRLKKNKSAGNLYDELYGGEAGAVEWEALTEAQKTIYDEAVRAGAEHEDAIDAALHTFTSKKKLAKFVREIFS